MPDDVEDGQPPLNAFELGAAGHRRQLFESVSDADSLTKGEQQLEPCHIGPFYTEGSGAPVMRTQKEDLENQRGSDRSIEKLLVNNNTNKNYVLQFVLLMSAAGLGMNLFYWFWTY